MFKIKVPIQGERLCVGDHKHNVLCKMLIDACPKEIANNVFKLIEDECTKLDFRWIHFWLSKTEITKICSLLKSKSPKILAKRRDSLVSYLERNPYQRILNQEKIQLIYKIVNFIAINFIS